MLFCFVFSIDFTISAKLHLLILSVYLVPGRALLKNAISWSGDTRYTSLKWDLSSQHLGGGVAIYIRNVIDYKIRSDLSDPDLEFLCIQIQKPKAKPFLLSNWYRPPNSPIELFDKLERSGECWMEYIWWYHISLVNCEMLAIFPANETRHLVELCESYQYTQLIKEPTRVRSSSKSLIDLFLNNNEPGKFVTSGVLHFGCSDHSLIYVSRKLTYHSTFPRIIESRQYKNLFPINLWMTWRCLLRT